MENKKLVCEKFLEVLKITRAGEGVTGLEFKDNGNFQFVYIKFSSGFEKQVNVSGDSGLAIIEDVARALY